MYDKELLEKVRKSFDFHALKTICGMKEAEFAKYAQRFDVSVEQGTPNPPAQSSGYTEEQMLILSDPQLTEDDYKYWKQEFERENSYYRSDEGVVIFDDDYRALDEPYHSGIYGGQAYGAREFNDEYYYFKDNGSKVLAIAHLDSVQDERWARLLTTPAEKMVFSPVLDDRLGAYVILDLLPKLGIQVDVLLTTNEEYGQSTASYFEARKKYNWMFQFDRAGSDVVMYRYENQLTKQIVEDYGFRVGKGSYSDISTLSHLGIKGFNFGVGYYDYHSRNGYCKLSETLGNIYKFALMFNDFKEVPLPHGEHVQESSKLDPSLSKEEKIEQLREIMGKVAKKVEHKYSWVPGSKKKKKHKHHTHQARRGNGQ